MVSTRFYRYRLKTQAWYGTIKWDKLIKGSFKSPYEPTVKHEKDYSNFRVNDTDLPPCPKYIDDRSGWERDF